MITYIFEILPTNRNTKKRQTKQTNRPRKRDNRQTIAP